MPGPVLQTMILSTRIIAALWVVASFARADVAGAQQATPPSAPPPVLRALPDSGAGVDPGPRPAEPAPSDALAPNRPGFIDAVGKWLEAPSWGLPPLKSPQQTIEEWNKSARDASDNLTRMSRQHVVSGRVKCPVAPNGAPDCKVAATKLCTDQGFKEGQSLDSDSAENCPAAALLSGEQPKQKQACKLENFVIRALCQ